MAPGSSERCHSTQVRKQIGRDVVNLPEKVSLMRYQHRFTSNTARHSMMSIRTTLRLRRGQNPRSAYGITVSQGQVSLEKPEKESTISSWPTSGGTTTSLTTQTTRQQSQKTSAETKVRPQVITSSFGPTHGITSQEKSKVLRSHQSTTRLLSPATTILRIQTSYQKI